MAEEEELRRHRCCFTGHRPEKLRMSEAEAATVLEREIRRSIAEGYTTYITGMARGVDIAAAEIVLRLRDEHPALRLICALPHEDFEKRWSASWQERFRIVLRGADLVRLISKDYSSGAYQIRNVWMVDHSARVIAVYNGTPGGTRNTIEYARQQKVEVVTIHDQQ